ncbi:tRNA 2-selenouridine(34) synthase MnmH [Bacillus dakarensis]|uniref:tRNA 2-selenouridine(34) synthase MnmH n=1 Tax=Robertmurraya dakarensis TaxID=1926278 RepID=UPI000981D509|nr:tRNA 2-selenouridine(34) synthase MnmH [Bacillus dakarensis]
MNHDLSVHDFLDKKKEYIPIDVRSPGEYHDSHIPNAVNIPLFTNEERAEVGTLYKQKGSQYAKWRAMEIVSPKLPNILGQIKEMIEEDQQPVVYCWRGGMRSQSVTLFASMSGLDILRISGGYRAYREAIIERIPLSIPEKAVVLYGLTGTGKTEILHNLKRLGYPVLDLEKHANHRGSVFGAMADKPPHNQKRFDAMLHEDLMRIEGSDYFFMEGESKRIGHAVQPPELFEKKNTGVHIRVVSSLETRVERIYEEYVKDFEDKNEFHERVGSALKRILKRVKPQEVQQLLETCLEEKNYREMIKLLIVYYYDPRYDNKINESIHTELEVNSDSVLEATKKIADFVDKMMLTKVVKS